MQTLQSTLRLGRDVWDPATLPIIEFEQRLERVRRWMTSRDLDLLLLYGRGLDHCGHPTYVSNYTVKLPVAAMVAVPASGDPVLLFQGASRGLPAARATTWMSEVRACGDVAQATLTLLAENRWPARAVGLAGIDRLMPEAQWQALSDALGDARVVDADAALHAIRAIKTPTEQDRIRQAGRLLTRSMTRLEQPELGLSDERSLEAALIREARLGGAEDVRVMLARPAHDNAFRPAEAQPLDDGSVVAVNAGLSVERYWAQTCRTFAVHSGRLVPAATPALDELATRHRACVRAGRTMDDVALAMEGVTSAAPAPRSHGIGLEIEEPPAVERGGSAVVTPGMCLVLRSAYEDEAQGTLHRADTIIVRDGDVDVVTAARSR